MDYKSYVKAKGPELRASIVRRLLSGEEVPTSEFARLARFTPWGEATLRRAIEAEVTLLKLRKVR